MNLEKDFSLCTSREQMEKVGITCPDCRLVYDLILITHCCNDPPCGLNGSISYDERNSICAQDIIASGEHKVVARCYKCSKNHARMTRPRMGKCPQCQFEGRYVYTNDDQRCVSCKSTNDKNNKINSDLITIDNKLVNMVYLLDNTVNNTNDNTDNSNNITNITNNIANITNNIIKENMKICFQITDESDTIITAYTKKSINSEQIYYDKIYCAKDSWYILSDFLTKCSAEYNISWNNHNFEQCVLLQKYYDAYDNDKKYPINLINW